MGQHGSIAGTVSSVKQRAFDRCFIVGAGAIGSVLCAALKLSNTIDVYLVGQSPHAQSVGKNGLTLRRQAKKDLHVELPVLSMQRMPPLGPDDLIVLLNKLPAIETLARDLKTRLQRSTAVIALQNGIGVRSYVAAALGRDVDRGLVFFGANSQHSGTVTYYPAAGIRLHASAVNRAFCRLLHKGLVPGEISEDFQAMVWKKLVINCVANPLAGILNISNYDITRPILNDAKAAIIAEVQAIAAAEGVELNVTVADMNRYLASENTPSLVADLKRHQKTEIEFINGAVVRMAEKHGLPVPANKLVVSLVKFLEGR